MELNSRKISVVCWIYIVVAQWNNRPPVNMSLYSGDSNTNFDIKLSVHEAFLE
jgi:hypothetical protein